MKNKIRNQLVPKIVRSILTLFFRVKVSGTYQGGQANGHDRTLVIANHSSFLDGVLLALFLPEAPVFVINTDIAKNWLFSFFLRYVDHLAVDPTHPMAMKQVVHLLEGGRSVAIFPEGRITRTGALMKVYAGAAFAATKADATIIPVCITGTRLTYFSRVKELFPPKLFPQVRLTILPPLKLTVDNSLTAHEQHNNAKEEMHRVMMEMTVAAHKPVTIFDQLLISRKMFGRKVFAYEDGITDELSFDGLVKKSIALSVILAKQNLPKRVGLMLPTSSPAVLSFYALQYMGKVPAMLNFTSGIRAIKAGMTACDSDTILTSRAVVEKANLHDLIEQLTDYRIVYLEDLRESVTSANKVQIIVQRTFPNWKKAKLSPNEEAVVLFTSGSEGLPKGVVHSHDSLLFNVTQILTIYDITPRDKFMICLPMFHVFGLMAGALLPVVSGAGAFLYPNPLHYRAIPEVIYDRDCTVLLSASTFLNGYARYADPYDFRSLRYIIAGAEKLSNEVVKTYQEAFGIRIMEGYGATETAPVISANNNMSYSRGSVGTLLPGMTAELVPVDGIQEGGKLVVRADNVMLGYLSAENPGTVVSTPITEGKREYDTGDIVDIDRRGFIYIKGRAKRFAKLAGEMVSLDSVEKLATFTSGEHHHAVISLPDVKKGEVLILFTTDEVLNRKILQKSAKKLGLPELAIPRDIRLLKEIPVFSSGKTNYPALTELV